MGASNSERLHDLLSRTCEDDDLRVRLIADPRATLQSEAGISVPEGVELVVLEDSAERAHLVLPARSADVEIEALTDEDLQTTEAAGPNMMGQGAGSFGQGAGSYGEGAGLWAQGGFQGGVGLLGGGAGLIQGDEV